MATTSDFRNGMIMNFKNELYEIIEFLHVKPGKGGAFVRTKLRNVKTGKVIENTFRTSERIEEVRVEKHKKEYLYFDGDFYVFMDSNTFEQMQVTPEIIGDYDKMLIENMEVAMKLDPDGNIMGIELPTTVVQEIAECEPNVKGNSASVSGKKAVTDRGLSLTVPFFIEVGDKIKIDTRTGEYIERT
ncbi:MAG TPA: elongation factor P [Candidatus Cloacimonadota bacterium]|nr:elongation factor P [Candidatus Cloacimonadota bacterium]